MSEFIVAVVALAILYGVGSCSAKVSCHRQWDESGMQARWQFFSGCMVSKDGGKTWMPAKNYRDID